MSYSMTRSEVKTRGSEGLYELRMSYSEPNPLTCDVKVWNHHVLRRR